MLSQRPSRVWTLLATATWVWVAGAAVAVGEPGRHPLTSICWIPLPQVRVNKGVLLEKLQRATNGGVMGPFDLRRDCRFSERPQR